MNTIRSHHDLAMENAELALVAQMKGNKNEASDLFKQALNAELAAIKAAEMNGCIEPTYSVLQRSAATLALDCNEIRWAERIVAKALAQDPPPEIAEELRDLLEQINFKRHLELKGIFLEEDEFQMNLSGRGVGHGLVDSDEFLKRVENTSKAIFRIVERRQNRPFREKGRLTGAIKENYELFVSVPRAASFSITLKLGRPTAQLNLPGILKASAIVDEFMDLMDLANQNKLEEIREKIPDSAYFRNFVALAKQVAPDGNIVRQVGFTSIRPDGQRSVQITRPAQEFPIVPVDPKPVSSELVAVKGVLRYADATSSKSGLIKVVEGGDGGLTHLIEVPEGVMADIVRPMWDLVVIVRGRRKGDQIMLEDIQEA